MDSSSSAPITQAFEVDSKMDLQIAAYVVALHDFFPIEIARMIAQDAVDLQRFSRTYFFHTSTIITGLRTETEYAFRLDLDADEAILTKVSTNIDGQHVDEMRSPYFVKDGGNLQLLTERKYVFTEIFTSAMKYEKTVWFPKDISFVKVGVKSFKPFNERKSSCKQLNSKGSAATKKSITRRELSNCKKSAETFLLSRAPELFTITGDILARFNGRKFSLSLAIDEAWKNGKITTNEQKYLHTLS